MVWTVILMMLLKLGGPSANGRQTEESKQVNRLSKEQIAQPIELISTSDHFMQNFFWRLELTQPLHEHLHYLYRTMIII